MSYSGLGVLGATKGLGVASGAPLRSGSDAANPMDTGGIVPAECATLSQAPGAPRTIQPNQILVVSFPFVLGDPAKIPLILAEILGAEGGGGNALVSFVTTTPNKLTFVGGGWMRDAKSDQSVTKGTLFLALRPRVATSSSLLRSWARLLLIAAIGARGTSVTISSSARLGPKINLTLSWMSVAAGESDDDLRQAAYASAAAYAQFGSFIRFALQGAPQVTRRSAQLSSEFQVLARKIIGAQQLVMQGNTLPGAADGVIASALAMPHDQSTQAIALLDAVRGQLTTALASIRAGVAAAPGLASGAGEQRAAVLTGVRNAVLATAEASIRSSSPLELMREYYRCALLKQAKTSIDTALHAVNAALDQGAAAALWLMNNAANVEAATKAIEEALARIEDAIAQVPMGWLLRRRWGLPTWGWLGIGGVAFIGGAFGVRALKKRKSKAVRTNRRRLPRRTSR